MFDWRRPTRRPVKGDIFETPNPLSTYLWLDSDVSFFSNVSKLSVSITNYNYRWQSTTAEAAYHSTVDARSKALSAPHGPQTKCLDPPLS